MKHLNYSDEQDIPTGPHLALMTGDGRAIAIRPGAVILFIEDARKPPMPMIFTKLVPKKYIEFTAYSTDPRNRRKVRYKADWSGIYRSTTKDAVQNGPTDS